MTERLLQYIWQFQYFNTSSLVTAEGEELQIIYPGNLNTNQGPDFLGAKIKIGDTTWAGNVELHVQSTDWNLHQHSTDANYRNIILHVVFKNNADLGLSFPVLELDNRVSTFLLSRYDELMKATSFIPCEKNIHQVDWLIWKSWKDRLLTERLQHKTAVIGQHLAQNNHHWEETFWWLLAHSFGSRVNSGAFEKMARSLPLTILAKHKNQIHQVEALLFGQAGLLQQEFIDAYPRLLQKEYRFYKNKYHLQPINESLFFLRMRPANFPSVRLAQLAMLIHKSAHLFAVIKETQQLQQVKQLLNVTANDYWHYHYLFDEAADFKEKNTGSQMINTVLINTIVPIIFAYGQHNKEQAFQDRALLWLDELSAEKNSITNAFAELGIDNKNAFDSQALLQLKNEYCNQKRCLQCAIGNRLLKSVITRHS